jgi:Uma2 family endonuclease
MMATGTQISLDEYLSTIYDPDCEYVDGELIERNMGESDHSAIQMIIAGQLYNQRLQYGIHVFPELRVQVAATRYRVPDITVTRQKVRGKVLREPPFLCIEILSPEDRASRMELKIDDYIAFGVSHVWLIDPHRRKAWSYTSEGKRESSAVLKTSDPLLTLKLDEVFTALDDDIEA